MNSNSNTSKIIVRLSNALTKADSTLTDLRCELAQVILQSDNRTVDIRCDKFTNAVQNHLRKHSFSVKRIKNGYRIAILNESYALEDEVVVYNAPAKRIPKSAASQHNSATISDIKARLQESKALTKEQAAYLLTLLV